MKKILILLLLAAAVASCESCPMCELQDEQGILDESGEKCDEDFYNRCMKYDTTFTHVKCNCDLL